MLDLRRQQFNQPIQMLPSFGQYDRPAALANGFDNILPNQVVAFFIGNQFAVDLLELDSGILVVDRGRMKSRWANVNGVCKWAFSGLCFCVDAVTDRTALHEDDRMVSVFSRNGG